MPRGGCCQLNDSDSLLAASIRDRLEGELSDRYVIEGELGRGGMATVWLARDRRHDRPVAIKVLHSELAGAIGIDRFVREVRLTAKLQHPGVVPVFDSGVLPATDDVALPWYAMAYVPGESLRVRLEREVHLPVDEAVRIARDVAAALHGAHQQRIIHRDVKPENIILADGRVYVVDFGISKALFETGDDRLTSTGLSLGTPAYMSPEQATAGTLDARSDQYSLACVLYEMLVGEPPVTGPNAQAIIARRLADPVRPMRSVRSTVPEHIEAAVLRALERVPADRFPDIATFSAALENSGATIDSRKSRRSRRSAFALSVLVLVVISAASWAVYGRFAASASPKGPTSRDSTLRALYQRGLRGYALRTPAGAADAIQSFKAAIARDSTFAPAWSGLANTYVQALGRRFVFPGIVQDSVLQLAVAALNQALALDSTNSETWTSRATVSRMVDRTDMSHAIRAARKAIALDSTNVLAWQTLAITLADTGDMNAAFDAWRQCVRRNPSFTECLAFLALAYYWRGQYDSAAVWADSAVAVEPNYLLGRTSVGQVAVERGDFTRAIAAFEAARRLTTDVEVVNTLAGRAYAEARANDFTSARATLRVADSLATTYSPPPAHTAVYLAHAYVALGDANRAIAWLARYRIPRDQHFQLHLRCDPAFAAIANDRRYRSLLIAPAHRVQC